MQQSRDLLLQHDTVQTRYVKFQRTSGRIKDFRAAINLLTGNHALPSDSRPRRLLIRRFDDDFRDQQAS